MMQVKKALVVDDSRLARIALTKLLQLRDVDVDMVANGTEAVDYLRSSRPDVVFMDYMMPDMDGFEAVRKIRSLPDESDVPVVMYTAQEEDGDRERAKALGVAGFLTKPSGEESVDEILESLGQISRNPSPVTVTSESESSEPESSVEEASERPAPAATEPAAQTGFSQEIPWEDIQAVAREAAETTAVAAVQRVVEQQMESRQGEFDEAIRQALEAERGSTDTLVESTARRVAHDCAQETLGRFSEEMRAEVPEKVKAELRQELHNDMAELLATDAVRQQLTEIVLKTALPHLRDAVIEEVLPPIRDRVLEDTQRQASEAAQATAAQTARESAQAAREAAQDTAAQAAREAAQGAAAQAASEQAAVSVSEYQLQVEDRVRELVQEISAPPPVWRPVFISVAVSLVLIIVGVAVSVYLSTNGVSF